MDNENNSYDEDKELSSKMEKQLSTRSSLIRIIIAILAFIWFLLGGSAQTVLALSGGQLGFSGLVTFLIKNPVSFLIIGLLNVISGVILYIFSISLLIAIFHFLWSIRWFYGFKKYRGLKNTNLKN